MALLLSQVSVAQGQAFLLRSSLPGYADLMLVVATWLLAGDRPVRLHARLFSIDPGQRRAGPYAMLGLCKPGIWLLFVIPWIAPRGHSAGDTP